MNIFFCCAMHFHNNTYVNKLIYYDDDVYSSPTLLKDGVAVC